MCKKNEPFTPPKKKPSVLWWLAGGFGLLVFVFFLQLFGFHPAVVVSPGTTHITEPLGSDGLPDYERHILETTRQGVTPENNAAVPLWEALWPLELDPKDYPAVAAEIGMDQIPNGRQTLVRRSGPENRAAMWQWLRKQAGNPPGPTPVGSTPGLDPMSIEMDGPDSELVENAIANAGTQPWTGDQIPPLAKWIAANKLPLDLIVEASRRSRYYSPSPSHLNDVSEPLVATLLPGIQGVREAARSLATRAMWHLGEGRADDAWSDLSAVHRLGRLATQGPTLIEQLVGMAVDGIARDGTLALLDHGQLTAEQARKVQRDLAALPNFSSVADSMDEMERLMFLDAVIQLGVRKNRDMVAEFGIDDAVPVLNLVSVNWNIVLDIGNRYFDRLAAAARLADATKRDQAIDQIESDLYRMANEVRRPSALVAAAISPQTRSELVAAIMVSLLMPAVDAATRAEHRTNTLLELTRLAAALAVYRAEHATYPETLDDLVPGAMDKLPMDAQQGKPFFYRRTDDGYLLYSAGENGVDDGASNENMIILKGRTLVPGEMDPSEFERQTSQIPAGSDDYSIRLPTPRWQPPKLPLTDSP